MIKLNIWKVKCLCWWWLTWWWWWWLWWWQLWWWWLSALFVKLRPPLFAAPYIPGNHASHKQLLFKQPDCMVLNEYRLYWRSKRCSSKRYPESLGNHHHYQHPIKYNAFQSYAIFSRYSHDFHATTLMVINMMVMMMIMMMTIVMMVIICPIR